MAPGSKGALLRAGLGLVAAALLAACGKGTPITSGTPTPSPTLPPRVTSEYPLPTKNGDPVGIVLGSDGNLWFTEFAGSRIGQLSKQGKVTDIITPTKKAGPNGIASGGVATLNVWFTETNAGKVGQVTTDGPPYTEYTLPNPAARPVGITLGGDGNMWVTDPGTNSIWRIQQLPQKPFVVFTQYKLNGNAQPLGIANGPDNDIWFTEPGTNSIGRLGLGGSPLTDYRIQGANADPVTIVLGQDNAMWFTERHAKKLGRIASTGQITNEYPLTGSQTPDGLIQGIDGNFYFTDTAANKVGRFYTRSHKVSFYKVPTSNSQPTAMTIGPDQLIYFTESAGNSIAQFTYY